MENIKSLFEVIYLDDNNNKHLAYTTENELKTLENRYTIVERGISNEDWSSRNIQ